MLAHLALRTLRTVTWVALMAGLVSTAGIIVRLLPWLIAADVPLSVTTAFFFSLLPASLEVALFLALPIGCALETARWSHDGTIMTLRCLGLGPIRQLFNFIIVIFLFSTLILLVATQSAHLLNSPGHVSNELIDAAKSETCPEGSARIPGLEVSWLCPGKTPRLVGILPPTGPTTMAFTASNAAFSTSLDRIELKNVHWASHPNITVHAHNVSIVGIVPWMAPGTTNPWLRGLSSALASFLASIATGWTLLRWPSASRPRAMLVAVSAIWGFLVWGGFLLERLSWLGLLPICAMTTALPILLSRATHHPWLLGKHRGGTQRKNPLDLVGNTTDV